MTCSSCGTSLHRCIICKTCWWLIMIGGLNWGLVGLGWLFGGSDWNVVHMIFGSWMKVEAIIYVLVGIATLKKLFYRCNCTKDQGMGGQASMQK